MISFFSTGSMEKALCRLFRHCLGHMENCLVLYFHLNWFPDELGKPGRRTDARWSRQKQRGFVWPVPSKLEFLTTYVLPVKILLRVFQVFTFDLSQMWHLWHHVTSLRVTWRKMKKLSSWFLRYYHSELVNQITVDLSCFQRLSIYSKFSTFNFNPADCLSCDLCYHQLLTSISLDRTNVWLLQLSSK